eukprot:CAMPEP_0113452206 /NCGR_PEP_ID=MMETSP0014_2-20120614/6729_1 /TAXON_ID=2857 /ORGANISM="Nitzschia sp." /LENGTH=791 /DNA_ID=CAMNT_0000343575 /DNA_START=49 /DNA_END=2424 /DNA_ORIENTATION=+ /assembly_acc=CAM_ASM_000159
MPANVRRETMTMTMTMTTDADNGNSHCGDRRRRKRRTNDEVTKITKNKKWLLSWLIVSAAAVGFYSPSSSSSSSWSSSFLLQTSPQSGCVSALLLVDNSYQHHPRRLSSSHTRLKLEAISKTTREVQKNKKHPSISSLSSTEEVLPWFRKIKLTKWHGKGKKKKKQHTSRTGVLGPVQQQHQQQEEEDIDISNRADDLDQLPQKVIVEISTLDEFYDYLYNNRSTSMEERPSRMVKNDVDDGANTGDNRDNNFARFLQTVSIKGDTQIIGSKDHPDFVHPVVELVHERRRRREQRQKESSSDEENNIGQDNQHDGSKVALVIEGGGMRGSVSAGMACAVHYLGLSDTIDVVYGSSAGSVVGAYFCSRQVPWYGPEVYYDQLTKQTAGKNFIDLKRILRSVGLGLADPRLIKDVLTRPENGKPLLNLHYLLETVIQGHKPLDWDAFKDRQKIQPLRIVSTGLRSETSIILDENSGHLDTLEDLCNALHASCLLPGIAGPVMNILKDASIRTKSTKLSSSSSSSSQQPSTEKPLYVIQNGHDDQDYEPLGDAMLSSPIPYDIAHQEGATHVIVLRSSPDGKNVVDCNPTKSFIESLILRRFFRRKNNLPGMYEKLQTEQFHHVKYAESILDLNARARPPFQSQSKNNNVDDGDGHYTMTIALDADAEEVSQLETSREAIFEGVRLGFARAYDALVDDPSRRGNGYDVAVRCFPDEILHYDPTDFMDDAGVDDEADGDGDIDSDINAVRNDIPSSAFAQFLSTEGIVPKSWQDKGGHGGNDLQRITSHGNQHYQ